MTALAKKSMLARLLARENITVEQTNHHTAFFDVEKRVLGLPYWKDVSKDLYDLLVGHEIGHALHTPADGLHSSTTDIPGCPRSYVNVVEDIRIEKLVLREFPGLLGAFMRGYQDLLDRNFFGIKNEDANKLSFMNRLNIFAKTRGLVKVKFSSKEQPYLDRAMAVETWDDVINSCRELYEFMKEEIEAERKTQRALQDLAEKMGIEPSKSIPNKIIISAKQKGEESKKTEVSEELKEAIRQGDVEIEVDVESFKEVEDEEPSTSGNSNDADTVETDALFRAAVKNALVDTITSGGTTLYAKGPTKGLADAIIVPYEKVAKHRNIPKGDNFPEKKFIKFNADTKDTVSVMVKEFEMKKTARRYARARTSTKGSLDVNTLHRYRFDDHLFKQVTHLDDDQSHGMIMLVDYSGSMGPVITKVLKQLLILISFCKRVNIPFEVYGFTNPNYTLSYDRELNAAKQNQRQVLTSVHMNNVHVFKLIDSSMKKTVFERAYRELFMQSTSKIYMGSFEQMNGTPLDQAIMLMYHRIVDFRMKHNVQKMNFITLTDGQSDGVFITNGIDLKGHHSRHKTQVVEILGQRIDIGGYKQATPALLNGLRRMGVRTMNYHLIRAEGIIYYAPDLKKCEEEVGLAAIAKMKKEGCYVVDDNDGYDRQIFAALGNETFSLEDDEDDDDEDEEMKNLTEDFQNKIFKKKRDRLVAANFAEMIS